jgi:hypothetical protein
MPGSWSGRREALFVGTGGVVRAYTGSPMSAPRHSECVEIAG